ncbi:daunorubicin resistance protein DrrA family ABC transporter ATP-binding protein [Luedemannella flava]|uniref:Daunorubicin resistance protein DrrA family ABC transporter ATP-binding protein n=1 Tax=Luedemannella flava TaxID=349316 RepID=A0ABN2LDG9_9ACTN
MERGVVAEGLTKSFGSSRALEGLDLHVQEGTVGALLGPNGAGKTTTIRILTTLDTADTGQAFVGGFDIARQSHSVRTVIALTGQYAAVDGDLTGRENLIMVGRLYHLTRAAAKRRADELLERFMLGAAAGRLTGTYSGGMRRRLDLAASLVKPPGVLFLDEPTTGLDPPSREELWTVVRDLGREGTTVVLTTQYLEEADRLADHVTVVNHGRAVASGKPAELKATYGGDVLELVAPEQTVADQAAKLLAHRAGLGESAIGAGTVAGRVNVTVPSGTYSVVDAVRLLDAENLLLDDIALRRASLDEVFAALTAEGASS